VIKKSNYDSEDEFGYGLWVRFLGAIIGKKYIAKVTDLNLLVDSKSFYFND
jgi:hypothetical protein